MNWLNYINGLHILTEDAKNRINTAVTSLIEILEESEQKNNKPKPDEFDRFW
jgi:hypothetical protein